MTPAIVRTAREMYTARRQLLDQVSTRSGVPPAIIVAIWGAESNFGKFSGVRPTVAALATLAYDDRRPALFRAELFSALEILNRGDVDLARMRGSWAGAMGQNDGRPIEVADARTKDKPYDSIPGPFGAHNWHPMSFNPTTGLVYLPVQNVPLTLMDDKQWTHNSNVPGEPQTGTGWNTGVFINAVPPTSEPLRPSCRLGSGAAERSLAAGIRCIVEWRHAHHHR